MKLTQVEVIVDYRTERQQKIAEFMNRLDLGISDIAPPPMVIGFTTKAKVDKQYKKMIIPLGLLIKWLTLDHLIPKQNRM